MYEHARRLALFLVLAFAVAVQPSLAQAQIPYLQIPAAQPKYAAIVVDAATGEVLYAKRADSPRYPASITKVMTLYLTFEALAQGRVSLEDRVTVSTRAAAQPPSKLGLRPGDSLTLEEAMQALAIKSANDIAVAVAEHIGGSEARFVALMNLKAKELGMANTHFANPHGLPDSRQISSARDLAILSRAVMRDYPQQYRLFGQMQFTFRGQTMGNHNRLLGRMQGVDGLKTGYINASGFNLAVSAVRDGRRLVAVVLGGSSTAARDNHAEDLLLTGFSVLNRRAMGERITIAQNLFEPEPTGPVDRPPTAMGDSEQEGLRIVLAHAEPPPAATRPRAEPAGRWMVQVGAFKSKDDARKQLSLVRGRMGASLKGVDSEITDKVSGFYRARYVGFTEADAREACKDMKAKRLTCMVIKPS